MIDVLMFLFVIMVQQLTLKVSVSHCVLRLCYNHSELTATQPAGIFWNSSHRPLSSGAAMSKRSSLATYAAPWGFWRSGLFSEVNKKESVFF